MFLMQFVPTASWTHMIRTALVQRNEDSPRSTRLAGHGMHGEAWMVKVRNLPGRSIEAGMFCSSTPDSGSSVACSTTPWRSTTNDVVRQVIIPASRAGTGGLAYTNTDARSASDHRPSSPAALALTHSRQGALSCRTWSMMSSTCSRRATKIAPPAKICSMAALSKFSREAGLSRWRSRVEGPRS